MSELDNNVHIFCNLDDCEPKHAVSHDFSSYTWRAIPYETEQIKGVMLAADAESNVPDIRIKLGLTGTYDLYICIWSGGGHMEHGISIKLSRDGAWRFIQSDITGHNPKAFEEVWWKTACLEGDDLWIRHPEGGLPKASYLAYIKCIPVDLCKTQPRSSDELLKSTKRLIGMNDMHGLFYTKCPTDIEPILEEIEPYVNTDFEKIILEYWGGGDHPSKQTDKGMLFGEKKAVYPRKGDRLLAKSRLRLQAMGIDYYQQVIDYAKKAGLSVYLSRRMGAFAAETPYEQLFTSDFYQNNPPLRCLDKDGEPIARLSYAFDEVQEHILGTFSKMASYAPDGVGLLFNRGVPYLLYEEPIVTGYMTKTGIDPRTIAADDPDFLAYRAHFMTAFIRKLRTMLDAVAANTGVSRIRIGAHTLANQQENDFFGLDIASWIREGLIDDLVAYPIAHPSPSVKTPSAGDVVDIDVEYYVRLVKQSSCKLYIDLLPREMEPEQYRQRAMALYDSGVDGLCFWDTNARHPKLAQWNMIRSLGHEQQIKRTGADVFVKQRVIPVIRLNGIRVDRYPPSWGL